MTDQNKITITTETLLAKAQAGDTDAQYQLALHYANEPGTSQDIATCINWLESAARNNHIDSALPLQESMKRAMASNKMFVSQLNGIDEPPRQGMLKQ